MIDIKELENEIYEAKKQLGFLEAGLRIAIIKNEEELILNLPEGFRLKESFDGRDRSTSFTLFYKDKVIASEWDHYDHNKTHHGMKLALAKKAHETEKINNLMRQAKD